MGVPAFFRWLSRKYPSIVVNCVEEKKKVVNDTTIPVDNTAPNPHGVEFDNLYLDMNGIIHPCCHPEDKPAPANEEEMMVAIFEYIDRLFSIVRPRRLLYMAIDGVAPRAKMNQQRSRRFRASLEAAEQKEQIRLRREEMRAMNIPLPPEPEKKEHFDSNCITPGTPFMSRLSECLRYYIHERINSDPAWQKIMVILSDANVPGEGEHKIMNFIRRQRASPSHDPNTHHVLCGADADLIMLGLATHEPNFTIIREEFVPNRPKPCEICGKYGHTVEDCQGLASIEDDSVDLCAPAQRETQFIFVRLSVLREYLQRDLKIHNLPFRYDFERVLDDWVFMCFFVGNDFLPHLPSLEIREGAINRLVKLYKDCLYKTNGYLTSNGFLNLSRVQVIVSELGAVEDEIFRHRRQDELERARRTEARRQREMRSERPSYRLDGQFSPMTPGEHRSPLSNVRATAYEIRRNYMNGTQNMSGNSSYSSGQGTPGDVFLGKRKHEESVLEDPTAADEVRLWETGWKDRYFLSKFHVSPEETTFRQRVAHYYVQGLCWVLRYYYQGCASWTWFFPFHYAPFASDFVNIGDMAVEFPTDTEPIKPLEQLMSVFPPGSRSHLPDSWAALMIDPKSPIIDFYPDTFKVDLNGKKYLWQGVALLPFVDKARLDDTLQTVYEDLTLEERQRNGLGTDLLFVFAAHPAYSFLSTLYERAQDGPDGWIALDSSLCSGVSLEVAVDEFVVRNGNSFGSPLSVLPDVQDSRALSVRSRDPSYPEGYVFSCSRLPGAVDPAPSLKPEDWDDSRGNYRPVLGFTRSYQQAHLADSSARMFRASITSVEHSMHRALRPPLPPLMNNYGPMYAEGRLRNPVQPYRGQRMYYSQQQQQQQPFAHYSGRPPYRPPYQQSQGYHPPRDRRDDRSRAHLNAPIFSAPEDKRRRYNDDRRDDYGYYSRQRGDYASSSRQYDYRPGPDRRLPYNRRNYNR